MPLLASHFLECHLGIHYSRKCFGYLLSTTIFLGFRIFAYSNVSTDMYENLMPPNYLQLKELVKETQKECDVPKQISAIKAAQCYM